MVPAMSVPVFGPAGNRDEEARPIRNPTGGCDLRYPAPESSTTVHPELGEARERLA
jgi:hypothetical protein